MEGKVKLLGHSIHPILIVFPLGLLATAVIFDVIYLIWGNPVFETVTYWMTAAGLLGGLLAAPFGWIDWFGIPAGTRAKSIGLTHGIVNSVALVLFAASWYFRLDNPTRPAMAAHVLAILGALFALAGGWLGGELVERLGISVHSGANANAPSSLRTNIPGARPTAEP